MTVVSKFSLLHIFKGFFFLGAFYTLTYYLFHYEELPSGFPPSIYIMGNPIPVMEYVGTTTNEFIIMILVNIAILIVFYIFFWRHTQITVTEENIIFTNLVTRRKRRVKYDEITSINRRSNYRTINLRNRTAISYDIDTYANYKEIYHCILANWNKNK